MTLTEAQVRVINLLEVLQEEAEESGRAVPEPPEEAVTSWSEEEVRAYFKSGGEQRPAAQSGAAAAPAAGPVPAATAADFPPPSPELLAKWFPGLPLSKTACEKPRLRVLCFANAGNAEDMYTSEGTGPRKAPSPLLEWCRAHQAEVLAVQLPGRAMRSKEPLLTTCQAVAAAVLPVVAHKLLEAPYVVVAHSVGTWCAYELLRLARQLGLPMPVHAFLSAMASPDIPWDARPWRQQRGLSEQEFKARNEECRGWDVNEVVFSSALWPTYQPLMRADFTLFDEFQHQHERQPPFDFPISVFWGSRDRRIKQEMVQGWERFTSGAFRLQRIQGHHLWPLEREGKASWLQQVAGELAQLQLD